MVSDGRKEDGEGGQSLLAVHHKKLGDTRRSVGWARRNDQGTDEVTGSMVHGPVFRDLNEVVPESLKLRPCEGH
jgi:hypothetical protein